MIINNAILHIVCYNQDLNCSVFCKVDDNLTMNAFGCSSWLVLDIKSTGLRSKILSNPQKTAFACRAVQSFWFFFPVVYMCASLISLHTCWSCRALLGRTREVPLLVEARWAGACSHPPALWGTHSYCWFSPWGAGGRARMSFLLKSKTRERSQHFLSETLLAEAPLQGVTCSSVYQADVAPCFPFNKPFVLGFCWQEETF